MCAMNANNPMTPGVYTVEIPAFPPAVGQVPTAIPAFVGYTQSASYNGNSLVGVPVLINSLTDYNNYFGGAPDYQFPIENVPALPTGGAPPSYDLKIGTKYLAIGAPTSGNFLMYNSLQFFYLNGGGPAYIVSVGTYNQPQMNTASPPVLENLPYKIQLADLLGGLNILPTIQFPKPTMILIPDGLLLNFNDYSTLTQETIQQAGTLMDRVALLDIYQGYMDLTTSTIPNFRSAVGVSFLDYATAYYPWINTSVVSSSSINFSNIDTTSTGTDPATGYAYVPINTLIYSPLIGTLTSITADYLFLEETLPVPPGGPPDWTSAFNSAQAGPGSGNSSTQVLLQNQGTVLAQMYQTLVNLANASSAPPATPVTAITAANSITNQDLIGSIAAMITPNGSLSQAMFAIAVAELNYGITPTVGTSANIAAWKWSPAPAKSSPVPAMPASLYNLLEPQYTSTFNSLLSALNNAINTADTLLIQYNSSLSNSNSDYANLMTAISNKVNLLPPGPAMAGIYTATDNTSGVWEAPANVNIIGAVSPSVTITDDSQAGLNVDALAGKSINAIRSFYGRGPAMVWGARTLDGNDLDYRYISVRRTMIMIEQSIANAAFSMVFAPNDSTTWAAMNGMISNFLNNIWKAGGLQGSSAADAYNVQVGLGQTMTSLDILNGIMRVAVKVAVVRPAEFIIITYEQQMATS
jgi:hypothetical protein